MTQNSDKEILFIGKITASFTHEIKNVLASIKELTGLMNDLVSMSEDFPLKEKLQKTIPRITAQLDRGNELTMNFNAFAHIPDAEKETLDIKAVTVHMAYLFRRIARQKNIELVVPGENVSAEIKISPLHLYMGIFSVLEFMINRMNNGAVRILTAANDGEVKVNLLCDRELFDIEKLIVDLESSDEWSEVKMIVGVSGCSVNFNESDGGFEIKLPEVKGIN
jgi:hypothetical protein